jgi:hypothetical protein
MASERVTEVGGWGNLYFPPRGALGPSPCCGGGLRAPFLFGRVVAVMADHTRPRVWSSPFFPCPSTGDIPVQPRFLRRPRLLTRM